MYRIIHDGEDIQFIGEGDLPGASILYKDAELCGDAMAHPTWYKVVGNEIVLRDNWEAIRDAELQEAQQKNTRKQNIKTAQQTSGVRELTVEQATAYISGQMDTTDLDALAPVINDIANLADAKALLLNMAIELRKLHKNTEDILTKMVPYLLD
jgi:hypothetical protein